MTKYTFTLSFLTKEPLTEEDLHKIKDCLSQMMTDDPAVTICRVEEGEHKELSPKEVEEFKKTAGY